MSIWHSLYLSCADATPRETIVETLKQALSTQGYTLYNPFGIMPGMTYPQTVRLFVAPQAGNWIRILGEPDMTLLPTLSQHGALLSTRLAGDTAEINVYQHGAEADVVTVLASYLPADKSPDDLAQMLQSDTFNLPRIGSDQPQMMAVPLDALPEDVQQMAQGISAKHADKLFGKMTRKLVGGGEEAEAARALLQNRAADWNSPGGGRIRALMELLQMPLHWREPDFSTLRDAYQLHSRHQRKPDMNLLPGDAEAMAAVPNALEYVPVYGGRKA